MGIKYNGRKSFIRQSGGGITFDSSGTATQTVIWRGPSYLAASFRLGIPKNSPDFFQLILSNPPNESDSGPYTTFTAIYGGIADEISTNYPTLPGEPEDEDQLATTWNMSFRETSAVLGIVEEGRFGNYQVNYRAPFNTITFPRPGKTRPRSVSQKHESGIVSEADPKILTVYPMDAVAELLANNRSTLTPGGVISPVAAGSHLNQLFSKSKNGDWANTYEIEDIAVDFTRAFNGTSWTISETWTKKLIPVDNSDFLDE